MEGLHGEFTDRQVVLKLRQLGFNVQRSTMKPMYVPGFTAQDEARLLESWERHYNKKGYFRLALLPWPTTPVGDSRPGGLFWTEVIIVLEPIVFLSLGGYLQPALYTLLINLSGGNGYGALRMPCHWPLLRLRRRNCTSQVRNHAGWVLVV